jgi:site-specific DNA recombinase
METIATPRRGARYARISHDQAGDEHGVTNQLADEAAHAARRDITVTATYTDNDISATYGKLRPGYRAMMEAAARGEFNVILVFHTSRLWRNRKERAEGIEILRKAGISVEATKGPSLDMSTAYGRGLAGLLGEFDTMETEVKSERQVLAAKARAQAGMAPLGTRLRGYTTAGEIIEAEAAIVRDIFAWFHAGGSLRSIAARLSETGVSTRHGGAWNPSSVRDILSNPRYAGRVYYNRHADGQSEDWAPATFPAIVDEGVFDLVAAILADPRRRKHQGTDRKHLGSSLYLCGVCKASVRAQGSAQTAGVKYSRYRCPEGHVTRTGAPVDKYVTAVIRERLSRPDLATLLTVPAGDEAAAVTAELLKLRGRLAKTDQDYDEDLIDGKRYKEKKAKIQADIDQAEARRVRLLAGSEVAGIIGAPDPVAAFDASLLGAQRGVVDFFMTVKLLRVPQGRKGFDPETVVTTWKRG